VPAGTQVINELPFNVHLLSLQTVNGTANGKMITLLRLQHIFAEGEHPVWSKPAVVDLNKLFVSPYQISGVEEMNLTGSVVKGTEKVGKDGLPVVTLHPMQIKTFAITFFWLR